MLPAVDKQFLYPDAWLHQRLAALDGAGQPHARLLRQFGVWQQLPRLRAKARTRPLTPAARRFAGEQFTQAQKFLAWVDARGRRPAGVLQTDVDAWHTTQTWAVRPIDVVSRQDSSCCHQGATRASRGHAHG